MIATGSQERLDISDAVEPLIPQELLKELLEALVAANASEVPPDPDDAADLFDDVAEEQ